MADWCSRRAYLGIAADWCSWRAYELLSVQTDSTERSGIESDGLERTRVTID